MESVKLVHKFRSRRYKEYAAGYLFASPAIIGFLVLTLYPMLASLYYSFNNVELSGKMEWVGFENFLYLFRDSGSEFGKSITVTLVYTAVNVILVIGWCLAISLLLNREYTGRNFLRLVFYLPSVIPMLATSILWKIILQNQAQGGLLNQLLMALGLETKEWLMDSRLIFVSLFMMSLWTCGGTIVVFLATLQDVPEELLESVAIEGGNAWHKFRAVVFPTIEPVLFFQALMCMITSVQIFTQSVALSSNGSPDRMTYFINVMIYDHAFKRAGTRGLAAAEAWLVFIAILAVTGLLFLAQSRIQSRVGPESNHNPRHRRKSI